MLQFDENEFAAYYKPYIMTLAENGKGIIDNMIDSLDEILSTLNSISEAKQMYRYADGKWTIKELVQHIIDTERVFAYRALRFARRDTTNLPGFDQDEFNTTANANARNFEELLEELSLVRKSSISLFRSFDDDTLKLIGTASNSGMSVRATGYIISGHALHHLAVLKDRYLQ